MTSKYDVLSKEIITNIGGVENIKSLTHCATRLRFKVSDKERIEMDNLENVNGVIKVLDAGGQIQVVIGNQVADVYNTISDNYRLNTGNATTLDDDSEETESKNILNSFMDVVAGVFTPVLGALSGAGMLKGILILCTTMGWLVEESGTYRMLYAAADALFVFLPVILAYTSAEKFKANKFVAVGIGAALLYPDLTAAYSANEAITFMNIPVVLVNYSSSVIPIILSVFVLSKLEALLNKVTPDIIKRFFNKKNVTINE